MGVLVWYTCEQTRQLKRDVTHTHTHSVPPLPLLCDMGRMVSDRRDAARRQIQCPIEFCIDKGCCGRGRSAEKLGNDHQVTFRGKERPSTLLDQIKSVSLLTSRDSTTPHGKQKKPRQAAEYCSYVRSNSEPPRQNERLGSGAAPAQLEFSYLLPCSLLTFTPYAKNLHRKWTRASASPVLSCPVLSCPVHPLSMHCLSTANVVTRTGQQCPKNTTQ